ncbi:hypothetical protein GY21_10920 [Cryobacterium roopkundense]|nr:hypothetical protein GY21_10920 [Cryobacterium roopkundense]
MAALAVALALVVAACAPAPGEQDDSRSNPPPPTDSGNGRESAAIALVDIWRVSGAADEEVDTWLRLDVPEFQLWRDCGMIQGSWRATGSLFLASTYGASGECATGTTLPRVPWLESVSGYRAAGEGWELHDPQGTTLATLTRDGAPDPIPTAADFYTEPPVITDATREALRQPVPLAGSLTPASPEDLAARWVPESDSGTTDAHVVFEADGTWTGSDGCNGGQGRWVADGAGALLTTSGVSTLMSCDGAPVPYWVTQASWAVFDDGWLRLLDMHGSELGRLQQD